MSAPSLFSQLEERISQLPVEEQLLLIRRIQKNVTRKSDIGDQLKQMANDPEIQKEIQDIEAEFSITEEDGLA